MITQAIISANPPAAASGPASGSAGSDQSGSFQAMFASELNSAVKAQATSIKPVLVGGLDTADSKTGAKKDAGKSKTDSQDANPAALGAPQLIALPIPAPHIKAEPVAGKSSARDESASAPAAEVMAKSAGEKGRAALPEPIKADAAKPEAPKQTTSFAQKLAQDPQTAAKETTAVAQPNPKSAEIAAGGNSLPTPKANPADSLQANLDSKKTANLDIQTQSGATPAAIAPQPAAANSATNPNAPAKLTVDTPVGSPNWNADLGNKVVWMSNEKQHVAELHLNPPNLGPMEVRVTVNNDQTSVQFLSHHSEVRQAIEAAIPKLREMMADNGISLGNTSVGSGSFQQPSGFNGQSQDQPQSRQQGSSYSGSLFSQAAPIMVRSSRIEGRVDTFA